MTTKLSFVLVIVAMLVPPAHGQFFDSTGASVGQWIRSDVPDNVYANDNGVYVSNNAVLIGGPPNIAQGLLEFDLSAIPNNPLDLVGATLDLTVAHDASSLVPGQMAGLFDSTTGTATVASSWNTYQAEYAGSESALGGLGVVATGGGALTAGTVVSTVGTAADLTLIQAILNGGSGGLASFSLVSADVNTTGTYWGGAAGGFGGEAILTLEFSSDAVVPPCVQCDVALSEAVWFRSGEPTVNHINDGAIVSNDPAVIGGAPAKGIMEWDLSSISDDSSLLADARLILYAASGSHTLAPGQTAALIDTEGNTSTQLAGITWNVFNTEYDGNQTALEGLGVVTPGAAAIPAGNFIATQATAADLALIKAILDNNASAATKLTIAFTGDGNTTGQYWGDGSFGTAPILQLSFDGPLPTIVDPGDFNKDGNITTADYDIMRANWLTDAAPAFNEIGELTGDQLVNLDDFSAFKALFPGGASALAVALAANAVPEPSTLLLILATVPVWLGRRVRRQMR